MRGRPRKTHCKHGHEFAYNAVWTNSYRLNGKVYRVRKCRQCLLDYMRRQRHRLRVSEA